MTKPLNELDPFRTGLVAIAIGLALALGIVGLSVANFGTESYTTELEHTAGLRVGEDVQVHGVPNGEVTAIELREDRVRVTFALSSDIDLGSRTTATVKVATLLGTHYLEVKPEGGGELVDAHIPLERTQVPFNLQDVLETGTGALEDLDADLLAEALTEVADTLGASSEEIGPALEGVARLSDVVSRRSDQVGDLMTAARSVTDQLADSHEDVVGLMRQTNLVVSEVTARREAINRLLTETTELATALEAIVDSTRGELRPALRDLNHAIDFLNGQRRQLQEVLDVMGPAMRYVANATGNGPWVDLYSEDGALLADDVRCNLRQVSGCR
ncbi:MCE family protein [Nocardioides panacisoli]|uniref:MCE family protein n=1 Tax=Nocardioides panacisoli TaxID=627624 RepID=UPI001C62B1D6|nr:MCE family protein [Nocardioides panacisoli]QYJ04866.1 MCE family protein [Nocardioides panacisoli]